MQSKPSYQTVLFDLDGTLLDTLDDLGDAVNHALSRCGFPLHDRQAYAQMVGHGVRNLVTRALPADCREDGGLIDACLADFKSWYSDHIDVKTRPYAGIPQLLADLHREGVRMAVTSNKFQEGTDFLIRRFFPDIPFAAVLGNREGWPLKPDPAIVHTVLEKTGSPKADTVLAGDSPTDMKTALNGGISAIGVTWGYRSREALEEIASTNEASVRLVDTVGQLRSLLLP